MFEGYFIGLKRGETLRNAVLIAFGVGFMPLAAIAWYLHNNHLLWLSLVAYMMVLTIVLGWQLPATLSQGSTKEGSSQTV